MTIGLINHMIKPCEKNSNTNLAGITRSASGTPPGMIDFPPPLDISVDALATSAIFLFFASSKVKVVLNFFGAIPCSPRS